MPNGLVQRIEDGSFIPPDPGNTDWQRYQEFLKSGGVPESAAPVTNPQRSISDGQLAGVLIAKGVITQEDVSAAIEAVDAEPS